MAFLAPSQRIVGRAVLERARERWAVTLEPHAMTWLKRLFPKIAKNELGTVHLADTPENAMNLQWFATMYPIEWEPGDHVEARAAELRAQTTLVESMMAIGYKPPAFAGLAMPPRDYQAVAAAMVLASPRKALLLGDDTGVGKTHSAFAMMSDPRALPAIYVTLAALPWQVQEMLAKAAPGLRTHVIKTGTPYDVTHKPYSRTGAKIPPPDVYIITWTKLQGWAEHFAALGKMGKLGSIVFDEAHELRHEGTQRYAAAKHVAAEATYRLAMTATPTFGVGSQIFYLINCIMPDALGTWGEFVREWCVPGGDDKPVVADPDALGEHLKRMGIMLRRRRVDVGRTLPPFQRVRQPIEYDDSPLNDVKSRAGELASILLSFGNGLAKMEAAAELDLLMRQATGIAKARAAAEFIAALVEAGESVLVGVWHRSVIDILMEKLAKWKPVLFTGSESPKQKRESKRRFCDKKAPDHSPICLMSNRSGAGLDGLQYSGCSIIVHVELDFAPAVHEQFDGRVYRDGQPEPVVAYYLVTDAGSDPVIEDMLGMKGDQLAGLRDPRLARIVTTPDQTEIRDRMKRLAVDHLAKTDPAALMRLRDQAKARLLEAIMRDAPEAEVESLAAVVDALPPEVETR